MEAILLNSGGKDSRVTAAYAKSKGYALHSIFVGVNTHNLEGALPAARRTADLYCVDHFEFIYPVDWWIKDKLPGYSMAPFQGMGTHIVGCQYAVYLGCNMVLSGARADDKNFDNACTYLNQALACSSCTPLVTVLTPIWDVDFGDLIRELKIPLKDTYSCHSYPACGTCKKCKELQKWLS